MVKGVLFFTKFGKSLGGGGSTVPAINAMETGLPAIENVSVDKSFV